MCLSSQTVQPNRWMELGFLRAAVSCTTTLSTFLPVTLRQSNNVAQPQATFQALQTCSFPKRALHTDSNYVYLRATRAARRLRVHGWQGSSGPVPTHLWEQLFHKLDRIVEWVKVPSHTQVSGKEEVDKLAEEGRRSSPLCVKPSPAHYRTVDSPPPEIKRQRTCQHVMLTRTICKGLTFDQMVAPTIPFFSTIEFRGYRGPQNSPLQGGANSRILMRQRILVIKTPPPKSVSLYCKRRRPPTALLQAHATSLSPSTGEGNADRGYYWWN